MSKTRSRLEFLHAESGRGAAVYQSNRTQAPLVPVGEEGLFGIESAVGNIVDFQAFAQFISFALGLSTAAIIAMVVNRPRMPRQRLVLGLLLLVTGGFVGCYVWFAESRFVMEPFEFSLAREIGIVFLTSLMPVFHAVAAYLTDGPQFSIKRQLQILAFVAIVSAIGSQMLFVGGVTLFTFGQALNAALVLMVFGYLVLIVVRGLGLVNGLRTQNSDLLAMVADTYQLSHGEFLREIRRRSGLSRLGIARLVGLANVDRKELAKGFPVGQVVNRSSGPADSGALGEFFVQHDATHAFRLPAGDASLVLVAKAPWHWPNEVTSSIFRAIGAVLSRVGESEIRDFGLNEQFYSEKSAEPSERSVENFPGI